MLLLLAASRWLRCEPSLLPAGVLSAGAGVYPAALEGIAVRPRRGLHGGQSDAAAKRCFPLQPPCLALTAGLGRWVCGRARGRERCW